MSRPTQALLSTENILHNIQWIQNKVKHSKIIAMVKANAYGHGIRSVGLRIADHVAMLGVASMDEAMFLRNCGIRTPIMLAEGVFDANEWSVAAHYNCQVVIHNAQQIDWIDNIPPTHRVSVWLKINTGMNRLGFHPKDIPQIYGRLQSNERIHNIIGLMSHFASSEIQDDPTTEDQSRKMGHIRQAIPDFNGPVTLCNSGGILHRPDDYYDYVRPGILIHGVSPKPGTTGHSLGLRPVMTLQSALISAYTAQKGDKVGYNGTYTCPETMPIGIAAIGYGDGYPFSACSGTPVLVQDAMCHLIGRVSMDMIAVDLRNLPNAKIGDTVTLWGEDLPIEQVAQHTQENSYSLLTGLHHRVRCHWTSQPIEAELDQHTQSTRTTATTGTSSTPSQST